MPTSTGVTRARLESLARHLERDPPLPAAQLHRLATALGVEGQTPTVSSIAERARFLSTTGFSQLSAAGSTRLADIDAAVLQAAQLQQARNSTLSWTASDAVFRDLQVTSPDGETANVKVPLTHVYEHNQRLFDARHDVRATPPTQASVAMERVPERYAALLNTYASIVAGCPGVVRRRTIAEATVLGRHYSVAAYQIGNDPPPPGKVGLVLTAGVHGDEMGAVTGLADTFGRLLMRPDLLRRFEPIVVIPAVNPANLDLGIREDLDGQDPNRKFWKPGAQLSFGSLAAQSLLAAAQPQSPYLFIDLHQDDRYAVDQGYALYNNGPSRALAEQGLAGLSASGRRPVTDDIDGISNQAGALPKAYANTFTPNPQRDIQFTREVLLEINDPDGFWPALERVLTSNELETLAR